MRIKKYIAPSMREALIQIKEELGEDAVILKTATLKKKMFGLAGDDEIEVTAAVDENAKTPAKKPEFPPIKVKPELPDVSALPQIATAATAPIAPPIDMSAAASSAHSASSAPNIRPYFPPKKQVASPFAKTEPDHDEIAEIKADVRELKELVRNVLANVASPFTAEGWDVFVRRLTESEVKPEIAKRLIDSIRVSGPDVVDTEFEEKLIETLTAQFPTSGPLKLKKGEPQKIAFVGPTGSGKTTTLAKLAAHCCFNKSKKVSIIAADTYRIAAIEQIRTFADIVHVDLQVVFSPDEVHDALAACRESDVIFVDTAGRSQRNKEHMEELRLLMDVLRPDETHLVLSATTKDSDLLDMVRNYRNIRVNRLLFTKLDETSRLGNIFNAVSELGIPVSYFTTGQSVPDDIELAQAGKFVKLLLEGRTL